MPRKYWSQEEIELLKSLWMTDIQKNIALNIGRTVDACYNKAHRIAKDDVEFKNVLSKREPAYRDLVDDHLSKWMIECHGRPENRMRV